MPSLRRSSSSSSVRSSPYPSSLSTSSPSVIRPRATTPHHRRSSGSATAERRVLADIEWWRVHDGQCDLDPLDHLQEDLQALDGDAPPGGTVSLSAVRGSPQTLHSFSMDSMQSVLSIAPHSPASSRHGRESSVESTPELSAAPLESIRLALADPLSSPLGHHLLFPSSLATMGGRQVHPLFGLRSVSAPDPSRQGTTAQPDFGDMGGDSFSFDQNLFQ